MATKAVGKNLLEELCVCMSEDLERLAFNEGKKSTFITENLMMECIKTMAFTEQHPTVHTLDLHDAKQMAEESVKTFVARV